jgi:hypothetical protein
VSFDFVVAIEFDLFGDRHLSGVDNFRHVVVVVVVVVAFVVVYCIFVCAQSIGTR